MLSTHFANEKKKRNVSAKQAVSLVTSLTTVIILPLYSIRMGNVEQSFCCDHGAEISLFQSNKTIFEPKHQDIIRNRNRNERKYSKDETSIIDQLEIKSEVQREERLSIKRKSKETDKIIKQVLTGREKTASGSTKEKENEREREREREWYEYKLRQLQEERRQDRESKQKELENEFRAKHSLKEKKKEEKKYDFQFIVNYRN